MALSKKEQTLANLAAMANDPNLNEYAAANAAKLLHEYAQRYGLNLDDIRSKSDATHESHYRASGPQYSTKGNGWDMVDKFVSMTIGDYYCVKTWGSLDADGDRVVNFYGHEVDVEAATALRWIIRAAMALEWGSWKRVHLDTLRESGIRPSVSEITDMKLSFHRSFGERIKERLEFYHRPDSVQKGGTSLVVAKRDLMVHHFEKYAADNNLGLRASRTRISGGNAAAAAAGRAAGSRADFGRGVGQSTLRIGR